MPERFIDFAMNQIRRLYAYYWPVFHLKLTITCSVETELRHSSQNNK